MKLLDKIMSYLGWSNVSNLLPMYGERVHITPFGQSVNFLSGKFSGGGKDYNPIYWKIDYSMQSIRQAMDIAIWKRDRLKKQLISRLREVYKLPETIVSDRKLLAQTCNTETRNKIEIDMFGSKVYF